MIGTMVLQRMRKSWVMVSLALMVGMMPIFSGCYGTFPLTKAVYKFNGECSDNKWVQSVVMWVLVIIPVYGIATLGDAIVCNLIEFWTGNPVELSDSQLPDGTKVSLLPGATAAEARLVLARNDGSTQTIRFIRDAQGNCEVRDNNHHLAGFVTRSPNGTLLLQDAKGKTIRTISADMVR